MLFKANRSAEGKWALMRQRIFCYTDDINTVTKNRGISKRDFINYHNVKDPMVNMQGPLLDSVP